MTHRRTSCLVLGLALVLALPACTDPPRECEPGQLGCACRVGDTCDEGLACDSEQGRCEGVRTLSLPAIDAAARSCELLLEDDSARVTGAAFGTTVRGVSIRQAPRTAVTFYGIEDAPIRRDAVRIEVVGSGAMRIERARCFDRTGRPVHGGGISTDG